MYVLIQVPSVTTFCCLQCVCSILIICMERGSSLLGNVSLVIQIWRGFLLLNGGIYQVFYNLTREMVCKTSIQSFLKLYAQNCSYFSHCLLLREFLKIQIQNWEKNWNTNHKFFFTISWNMWHKFRYFPSYSDKSWRTSSNLCEGQMRFTSTGDIFYHKIIVFCHSFLYSWHWYIAQQHAENIVAFPLKKCLFEFANMLRRTNIA
jgi:hypothetical protein